MIVTPIDTVWPPCFRYWSCCWVYSICCKTFAACKHVLPCVLMHTRTHARTHARTNARTHARTRTHSHTHTLLLDTSITSPNLHSKQICHVFRMCFIIFCILHIGICKLLPNLTPICNDVFIFLGGTMIYLRIKAQKS